MHNKYEEIADYDYKMIEAYIDKPEVTQWYVNAFKSFNVNGMDIGKWHWSWWAFFGSVFFLLYRKAYTAAGILFVLLIVAWFIPFGWLVLWILAGGYSTYFVYKTYREKFIEVENTIDDVEKRFETMRALGGANEWAIILGVIFQFLFWSAGIFMIGFIMTFIAFLLAAFGNAG